VSVCSQKNHPPYLNCISCIELEGYPLNHLLLSVLVSHDLHGWLPCHIFDKYVDLWSILFAGSYAIEQYYHHLLTLIA